MRHRFRISLYDDDELEQEIIDYISRSPRKQEMIRGFIRSGYSMIVKKMAESDAYLSSIPVEDQALTISALHSLAQKKNKEMGQDRLTESEKENDAMRSIVKSQEATTSIGGRSKRQLETVSQDEGDKQGGNVLKPPGDEDPIDFMELLRN